MKLTHEEIPHSLAKTLRMKTAREDTLNRYSNALGMDFGQSEKLTSRLRRILTGYPRDITILKELLQNADDAGATEIHFILDPRQHKTQSIFEDSWKPLQGPGLLVYNNKPFTEADMKGIQNLGEGSKGDDPTKTGQYGIGFNCVYHLTDAPMFITKGAEIGDTLCIFDPHCLYVPGASEASPGRRLQNLKELRKRFSDVFECFLENDLNSEEATVFRFPLRKDGIAQDSKISKAAISEEDVQRLLDTFITDLPECLLFLNNMRKVTISRVDEKSGNIREIYQVKAELDDDDIKKRKFFSEKVITAAQEIKKSRNISMVPCDVVVYDMKIEDSRERCREYRVGQQIGFDSTDETAPTIVQGYQTGELGLLPRGGVAFLSAHNNFGKNRHFSLREVSSSNKLFCFLPLPLKLDLPKGVQINGHFALDYESRRTLWQRENTGMKADWNKEMMGKIVGPLYARLLDDNAKKIDRLVAGNPHRKTDELEKHSRLFPSVSMKKQTHIYIDVLHDALYQNIRKKCLKVLPVTKPHTNNIEWHSTGNNVFFNDLSSCKSLRRQPIYTAFGSSVVIHKDPEPYQVVESILLEANFNLLKLPLSVHSSFMEAEVEVKLVNPEDVIRFFARHNMKMNLPKPLKDSTFKTMEGLQNVITYCKLDKLFFSKLAGLPILVTCDSELRVIDVFEEVFMSRYHVLVSNQQHRFMHWQLLSFFTPPDQKQNLPFKMFTVKDLEQLFRNDPKCTFMNRGIEVACLRERTLNTWLCTLWKFLKEEASKVMKGSWQGPVGDEDRSKLNGLLKPLAYWSVFPVTRQGKPCLFPLCRASTAVDLEQGDIMSEKVRLIMKKIDLPEPDYLVLGDNDTIFSHSNPTHLMKLLVASINNPAGVMICFQELLSECTLNVLDVDEARCLMQYFANHLETIKKVPGVMSALRKFPFYETVRGKLVSIENNHGYIVPNEIPTADMDCWENTKGEVFLKSIFALNDLYEFVGCVSLSEVEVYCSFILIQEHFEMMTEQGRNSHILYIRDTLLPDLESNRKNEHARKALVEKLMALQFIPGQHEELHGACEFYDPAHPVFHAMKKKEHFPSAQFRDEKWLDFLKEIGMVNEVTVDMFLEFANTVAVDATKHPGDKETARQSKVLIEHLINEFGEERPEWHERNFIKTISKVNFIVPHRVTKCLRTFHPQFNEMKIDEEPLYARYQDSIICSKIVDILTWSSSVLIPAWAEPKGINKNLLMESLGVSKIPTIDAVLNHLTTLCKHLDGEIDSTQADLVLAVFRDIYSFLNDYKSEHKTMKERLDNVMFLAVENGLRLVFAKQVAVEISPQNEIYPYLFKLPLAFGEFADLFVDLGVSKEATAEQYAQVLETIHAQVENEKMHPEEMRLAVRAFIGLVERAAEGPECLTRCLQIFLPSRDKRLLRSNELIFNDDILLESRLFMLKKPFVINRWSFAGTSEEYVCKAEIDKLQSMELSKFFKELPNHLKCTNLQDEIQEIMENQETTGTESHTDVVEEIKLKLRDPRFIQAVLRLLRHQEFVNGERKEESSPVEQEKQIKTKIVNGLERLKILMVEGAITTYMQYEGEKVEGSKGKCQMFHQKEINEDGNQQWVLYITNEANYITDMFWTDISEHINQLLDGGLKNSTALLAHVFKLRMDDISDFLDSRNIRRLLHTDSVPYFPSPGDPIPLQEHHLLLQDFLNFNEHEFVGKLNFLVSVFSNTLFTKTPHDKITHFQRFGNR